MRRHEKQAVGRGGAGNFQRKKNTTVPKEFGFTGTQVGSKLFRTMTRSSRSSSERSVIDISRTGKFPLRLSLAAWQPDSTRDSFVDRDSDLWSIADSTMSRASTPGIIISKFGESLLGKRQQQPIANANAPACTVTGTVTGVCYSDASPSPNPKSYYDVTSPYSTRRTPNEVAPFEEPVEPSPIAAAVFNAVASSSSGRQARPSRPALTRLVGSWSTDEYPPVPKSATSSTFSYPYTYDDTASFDSHRSRRSIARSTTPIMDFYRQSGLSAPLRPPPPWIHSTSSSITNDCPLPTVSTSASAALRMVARSPQDSDRFSDRTGMRSSGSSFYAGQYSGTSTDTESRNDYSVSKTPFPRFINPSHRASTGQYGTPHSPALSSPSRFSITTTHSASSVPQLESFTPTFGMKKLPSLPAASIHSFDERSLPSPPSTPLPGSLYSEDAYDSDGVTIPGLHTRQPC